MTVNSTVGKVTANGNGAATVFSFSPVTVFDSGDLLVTFVSTAGVETILSEGTGTANYSVSLSSLTDLPSTGSITYPASGGGHLANGESLVIKRVVDLTQATDLGNQGGYFPEVQEAEFDRLAMADIQQQDLIDRSIKLNTHTSGVSVELPNPVAGQGLIWNGSATALISSALTLTVDTSNTLINVSAVQPALVDGRIWIDTSVAGQRVVRICDGADYNEIVRFATAGGALTYVIPGTSTAAHTIALAAAGTPLALSVTDPGATGVVETTDHNSASPAAADVIWKKTYQGRDSGAAVQTYAEDQVVITDATAGSEDANHNFRTVVAGTVADRLKIGAGIFTPAQTDKGTDTINATNFYSGGVLMAASDVSTQSGAAHSPTLLDHGKTFIYTAAGGCTVTMPTLASVFPGWMIRIYNLSSGVTTVNRSAADFIRSKTTDLTTMKLPSTGDGGMLIADGGAGNQFVWIGKRSATIADVAVTVNSTSTQAHNLGVIPDNARVVLVNTIANLNYAPGDEVDPATFASAAAAAGYAVSYDATNVIVYHGPQAVAIPNKTTWATTVITAADWNLRFRNVSVIN